MGTISSSTGLISGLDIEGLVNSLMAIEARPVDLLKQQISDLEAERAAYMTISARLLSLKLAVVPFKSGVTFRPRSATSSNEDVLTATASSSACSRSPGVAGADSPPCPHASILPAFPWRGRGRFHGVLSAG